MFRLQTTIDGKRWRDLPFRKDCASEEEAWNYARSLDEDGWLRPDIRVIDTATKKAVKRPA